MTDVVIVDYGVGNLGSLVNALARVGKSAVVSKDLDIVANAPRLILPGVGAFDRAARRIREARLDEPIIHAATERGVPLAGVCLGMQLLLDGSEEGEEPGLGLISGTARRFPSEHAGRPLLAPHMGWSTVETAKRSKLVPAVVTGTRYYFVHSYAVHTDDEDDVLAWTDYGIRYASAIERGNIVGIQFHPEKSHRFGLALLKDFAEA